MVKQLQGEVHLEILCVDGRTLLKWILKKCAGTGWIQLAQVTAQYQKLFNTVMNVRVP